MPQRPEWCVGQFRLPGCRADLGLDDITLDHGMQLGAATLVIGVANRGGVVPAHWIDEILQALDYGYDVANGLHQRLSDIPEIAQAANSKGRLLFDVRHSNRTFPVGTGEKRSGRRVSMEGQLADALELTKLAKDEVNQDSLAAQLAPV